ncbi:hypothetical protein KKC61_04750 [Patescibacteria group bacterium]|nr:hypothetical protein [Patescibacteria group bacterium]
MVLRVVRSVQFQGVWDSLPLVEKCAWIFFFSTTISLITIVELLLLK